VVALPKHVRVACWRKPGARDLEGGGDEWGSTLRTAYHLFKSERDEYPDMGPEPDDA
ncbi:unnamed protein product, partial [Prorocentrum cordatum]